MIFKTNIFAKHFGAKKGYKTGVFFSMASHVQPATEFVPLVSKVSP